MLLSHVQAESGTDECVKTRARPKLRCITQSFLQFPGGAGNHLGSFSMENVAVGNQYLRTSVSRGLAPTFTTMLLCALQHGRQLAQR